MCCLTVVGMAFLRQKLADCAVLPFCRGTVVTPDVEDERVVAIAELVHPVDDAAHLSVHVLRKPGGHFHQPALEGFFVFRNALPRLDCRMWSKLGTLGIQPFSFARLKTRSR